MYESIEKRWLIVRCHSRQTIDLFKALRAFHMAVYTPQITVVGRVPRKKLRRKSVKPLLPGFLFVAEDDYKFCHWLSENHPMPKFQPFWVNGRHAACSSRELVGLQKQEQERKTDELKAGDLAVIGSSVLGGEYCTIIERQGSYYRVALASSGREIKVSAFLLQSFNS
jgi:hypothetical protein